MFWLKLKRFFIGKPLASSEMIHELIPKWKALPVLSSDALSSVAYATEEILLALLLVGSASIAWSVPIGIAILCLLFLITLSYRQTIESYPNGGGAYIVAKENLGQMAGLIAGASLLIDYVLTVSVSVASGVENLASAFPFIQDHMVAVGLVVIFFLMIMSLRGMSEASTVFALPCYLFIFSIFCMIAVGLYKAYVGVDVPAPELFVQKYPEVSWFLLLRAFSSGCSALTGVEAISNGVPVFREPKQHNAKSTLTSMAILLGIMFAGITYLAHTFRVLPSEHQTLISNLAQTVFGHSIMYYVLQAATALILFLAASTSYADFPRLSSLLAIDRYVPRQLSALGDRLVFSNGILGLSLAAAFLIVFFGGRTHHLIPLYAVGVFLSFTLSQAGMVVHHIKYKEPKWRISILFNGIGMIATFVVLLVISFSKFSQGAWMVILLIPIIVFTFTRIHAHYLDFAKEMSEVSISHENLEENLKQIVILPISGIHKGVLDAYRYSKTLSTDVRICFVEIDERQTQNLLEKWKMLNPHDEIIVLRSPFRSVVMPIIRYLDKVLRMEKIEFVTVVLPEFVTAKWYHQFLHNQTAFMLKTALLFKPKVVVTSVRYHLQTT